LLYNCCFIWFPQFSVKKQPGSSNKRIKDWNTERTDIRDFHGFFQVTSCPLLVFFSIFRIVRFRTIPEFSVFKPVHFQIAIFESIPEMTIIED
jgi:hypothetical protein